jgi:hypothetical protein
MIIRFFFDILITFMLKLIVQYNQRQYKFLHPNLYKAYQNFFTNLKS